MLVCSSSTWQVTWHLAVSLLTVFSMCVCVCVHDAFECNLLFGEIMQAYKAMASEGGMT